MNPLNSSISSSERSTGQPRRALPVAVWVILWIVAADVSINMLFAYPQDPRITSVSSLRQYFDYGRSTEAKLARMTRPESSETAPITLAGWYEPLRVNEPKPSAANQTVTFYGMSHAVQLAFALGRTSDHFVPRVVGAPGATANWAYGAYLRDRGGGKSRAVVLGVMAANLSMITTMSPVTWNLEFPMPYTADRFLIDNNKLQALQPSFASFEQYIATFYSERNWSSFRKLLAKHDPMYSPLIMRASLFDHSALFRLLRRAYGQRIIRTMRRNAIDQNGFDPASEPIQVARAIVRDFAVDARRAGMLPVVYLVNNLGYSHHLFQSLQPILDAQNIPCLSSHVIASPTDPRLYLPDSHFVDRVDDELARALVAIIESGQSSRDCSAPFGSSR
jgi:hypothetical protein